MSDLRKALEQAIEALHSDNPEIQLRAVIKVLVEMSASAEREACAKLCLEGTDMPVQVDAIKIIRAERERISNAIRARGIDVAKVGEVGVWGDKREWVGLTDEEREFFKGIGFVGVDIIEAKLKEKNT